jgi:hypothetical protein
VITITFFDIRGSLIKRVSPLTILTPESALSDKYKVTITVRKEIASGALAEWLSKTPQDSDVIVRTPPHLALRLTQ